MRRKTAGNGGSTAGPRASRASKPDSPRRDAQRRRPNVGSSETEDVKSVIDRHGRDLDELTGHVETLLGRQEWIQAGLYDLSVSLTALNHMNGATEEADAARKLADSRSIRAIREVVRRMLPRDAIVLVVNKGDEDLLDLYGRRAWHFPRGADENYAWYYPQDGTAVISHFEVLRARGAQYLLFPRSAMWWLESYPKFSQHLFRHYPVVLHDPGTCVLFSLEKHPVNDPTAWRARLVELTEDFVAHVGTEPSVLDWTALDLKEILPNQAVFTPQVKSPPLPYMDGSADIVVVSGAADGALEEARRIAGHAVVILDPAPPSQNEQALHNADERFRVQIEHVEGELQRTLPSSSIVIPTYDGHEQLHLCLTALEETLPHPFEGEVIVVADGSGDETQAVLERWEQSGTRLNLKVIRNESNVGFTESCNRGAAAATHEMLVFLNDDTLPQFRWLRSLLRTFRDQPNAGAVGGRLLYPDGRLQEAGNVIFSDGSGANFGKDSYEVDDPLYSFVREVDYCSAALLATPRSVFREVGGFDERYSPAYYEDTDYCFALRDRGYRVYYQPESVVVHVEGATSGTDLSTGVKKHQVLNQSKFVEKWQRQLADQPDPPDRYDLRTWQTLSIRGGAT